MKFNLKNIVRVSMAAALLAGLGSCDKFLDREPMSSVSPEIYFSSEAQLQAYVNNYYTSILPSHTSQWNYGMFGEDSGTDNQIGATIASRFTTSEWRVPHTENTNWSFNTLYYLNYYLSEVLPKFEAGEISGNNANIKHYIGEMYFLRAFHYFSKLQALGDFPIITEPLADDAEILTEASKRAPRNEVARFILEDLDKAISFMGDVNMATTRINKDVAVLVKSRVALFEASWLQNFKGTAFVPGGEGWPGGSSYAYPSGSIDSEITWFLQQAVDASKTVAEKYKGSLTANTGVMQQAAGDPANPYFDMFSSETLSDVPEVLLWRQYAPGYATNNISVYSCTGNNRIGITRGFVQNFLMADGTPVYTHGTYADGDGYYMGDKTLADVRVNRDTRLSVFLKEPGQNNIIYNVDGSDGNTATPVEPYPMITSGDAERAYTTGYALHKGGSLDKKHYNNGGGYTAAVSFRAAEALLNYMEASYLLNGNVDATAAEYWRLLRARAGVDTDFNKTIAATDMAKEAENDWGAYSAGQLVDATLYNIRRERRCEFIAEALRYMDLIRWRSMDQLIDNPVHFEGIHLWNTPMEEWYDDLVADGSSDANVSSKERSEYLRPYEKTPSQIGYNGATWKMAHYLNPIMVKQFQLTSPDADPANSVIYQNPYWPIVADQTATK